MVIRSIIYCMATKKSQLKKRIESLLWRSAGMAFVAGLAYVLQVGDIWSLDYKFLINVSVIAFAGLLMGELTKWLNPNK